MDEPVGTPESAADRPSSEASGEASGASSTGGVSATASGVPDPMEQNRTRVDFDITVPAYVSNELQVTLVWGARNLAASWVGDEFWTASDDFPTDTGGLLVVTFYDRNGAITLGSVERRFTTGTNQAQSYRIEQDDFDTAVWDEDGDGTSNLDELKAGTDPLVDEATVLQVRDQYHSFSVEDAIDAMMRVSAYYEPRIPQERPHYEYVEGEGPPSMLPAQPFSSTDRTVDIDASGSGSFFERRVYEDNRNGTVQVRTADRAVVDGRVSWNGSFSLEGPSSGRFDDIQFATTTEAIGERSRRQSGEIERTFREQRFSEVKTRQQISYDLTFEFSEDGLACVPVAGTITNDQEVTQESLTTITRAADDALWRVRVVTPGEGVDEYLVRGVGEQYFCDFADLP